MKAPHAGTTTLKTRILKMTCGIIAALAVVSIAAGSLSSYNGLLTNADNDLNSISNISSAAVSQSISELLTTAEQAAVTYRDNTAIGKHSLDKFCKSNSDKFKGAAVVTTSGKVVFSTVDTLKSISFANDKYLQKANTSGRPVLGSTASVSSGKVVIPVYLPVCDSDEIVVLQASGSFFSDIVKDFKIAQTGNVFVVDAEGDVIGSVNAALVNSRTNYISSAQSDSGKSSVAGLYTQMVAGKTGTVNYSMDGVSSACSFRPIPNGNGFSIGATVPTNEMTSSIAVTIGSIAVCMVVLAILCSFLINRFAGTITAPIVSCAKRLTALADGDLESEVPVTAAKDETGILLGKLASTITFLREVVSDISNYLAAIAKGDLTKSDPPVYKGNFAEVSTSIKAINESLNQIVEQIVQSSAEVTSGSEQIAAGAQALSQGATEQAASVEELAATIQGISTQVESNTQNADEAEKKASLTSEKLTLGKEEMQKMLSAMNDISDSSAQISKIIKSIEDIAFQTNILALNAAVEAARAGAAGKGFAVVADEVRNLANKSSAASKETARLIENSITSVQMGTGIANKAADIMDEIVVAADASTTLVKSISEASTEQDKAIQQVTIGMDQISSVVQTNSATAEESAAASEELSNQAATLKQLVGYFQTRGDFKNQ